MTAEPVIAGRRPMLVALEAGKPIFWCVCGRSARQPFCDGSHKGTSFAPIRHVPETNSDALLCACKRTRTPPFCDGSHNSLSIKYAEADPEAAADARFVDWVEKRDGLRIAQLDNGCFAARFDAGDAERYGALSLTCVMSRASGARHLSYYTGFLAPGETPILKFDGSDVAIFAVDGSPRIDISGQRFQMAPESGAYVSKDEAFYLHNESDRPVRVEIAVCPERGAIETLHAMPKNFDDAAPNRVAAVDPTKREQMADRFYQVLIDHALVGCAITQFIGEIPKSRAEHHRHLYEEALLILRGHGVMWTDHTKTPVEAGNLIFLPMRQAHSLECLSPDGMRLMGVFFPSGSPAINY